MTLRARVLERAVRRGVRAAIRNSRILRKELKDARKRGRRNLHLPRWSARAFFPILAGFILATNRNSIESLMAIIVLWSLGTTLLRAAQFRGALFFSPALGIYRHLPISDQQMFVLQWQAFLRMSLWLIVDFAVLYSMLTFKLLSGFEAVGAGLVLGLSQALFATAAAICLYAFVRPLVYRLAPLFLMSAIAMAIFGSKLGALTKVVIHFGYWIPPLGWIFQILGLSGWHGVPGEVLPGVMVAAVVSLFPIAWKRAREFYIPTEEIFFAAERAGANSPVPTLQGVAEHLKEDPGENETALKSRQFLQPLDWQKLGWLERLISRTLTPREKLIAEFLLAGRPGWTKGFRAFVMFLACALGGLSLFGWLRSIGPMFIVISGVLLFLGGQSNWRGLGLPRGSGLQSPYYALYPFGFRELMSTLIKVNLMRFFILLPILIPALLFLAHTLGMGNSLTLLSGLKLILLCLALQPFAAILLVSGSSNDTQNGLLSAIALIIVLAAGACSVTFFMATRLSSLLASGILTLALSAGSLWLYGWWFNRTGFDLVPVRTDVLIQK